MDKFLQPKLWGRLLAGLTVFTLVLSTFSNAALAQTAEPTATEVVDPLPTLIPTETVEPTLEATATEAPAASLTPEPTVTETSAGDESLPVHPSVSAAAQESVVVAYHAGTGQVRFMAPAAAGQSLAQPSLLAQNASPEAAARNFIASYGKVFGVRDQNQELHLARVLQEAGSRSTVKLQQYFQGVPVLAGEMIVNLDAANNVLAVNGEISPEPGISTTPAVDPGIAQATAIEAAARDNEVDAAGLVGSTPELWVYDPRLLTPEGGPTVLVWRVEVTSIEMLPVRQLVLVDAQRGNVVLNINQTDFALNRQTYTANNSTSVPGSLVCNESNPTCSGGDSHAVAAHKYAGDTYNFYLTNHGRDSIDGAGMAIVSTVHYGSNYNNAYWDDVLLQMVYGDLYGFSLADDVVGHELTHGVTQFESDLLYFYQSGAINESLSDIWGEFVDLTNGQGNDTSGVRWQIGEDISTLGTIRDMKTPGNYDQPDKMTSGDYYTGSGDNGGVHYNSGINNKAAYLLVDGGTFNGKTITSIGLTKTAKIYYEVQTHLLTSGSDYNDLYNYLIQGCNNLIGTSGISASDCTQVTNAVQAVEMNLQPVANFNPDAEVCPVGKFAVNVFYDDMENGFNNWTLGAVSGTSAWTTSGAPQANNHSGTHALYANDSYASSNSYAAWTTAITIPPASYLHFYHYYELEPAWDGAVIEYSANGGAWTKASSLINSGKTATVTTNTTGANSFGGSSHGYVSTRLDLSSLAGQSVKFRWRLNTDSAVYRLGWWVDDVSLYRCVTKSDAVSDFEGDGKTDVAKYLNNGALWWKTSSNNMWNGFYLGSDTVQFVPASDFDGDGKTDPAKFLPNPGVVWWYKSTTSSWDGLYLGSDSYQYIPASDFDGDGITDPTKFYSNPGVVWWYQSTTSSWGGLFMGADSYQFIGGSDFDGDGKTDPAKFYSADKTLWWHKSSGGGWQGVYLGPGTYSYLAGGDYDGDGKTDPAIYTSGNGNISWLKLSTGTWATIALGNEASLQHVLGVDFDGDGKTDAAKFIINTKTLWWVKSSTGQWQSVSPGNDTYMLVSGIN